jgi:hypothetical protein
VKKTAPLFCSKAAGAGTPEKTNPRKKKMDIEWLAAAMRDVNSLVRGPFEAVVEPALVRRHRGVRGLDGDLDAQQTRVEDRVSIVGA